MDQTKETKKNEIFSHQVNRTNRGIRIYIAQIDRDSKAPQMFSLILEDQTMIDLRFAHQEVNGAFVPGLTNEALLAIVEARLEGFQEGPFKSRENAIALTKTQEAMQWLERGTRKRQQKSR
jgi:hypothetical protein